MPDILPLTTREDVILLVGILIGIVAGMFAHAGISSSPPPKRDDHRAP